MIGSGEPGRTGGTAVADFATMSPGKFPDTVSERDDVAERDIAGCELAVGRPAQ
jgi:hypothetical protein